MNYLLDTCLISELVKPRADRRVIAWLASVPEDRLYLSVLTLGELQKGIVKLGNGTRARRLREWLDVEVRGRFADRLLVADEEVLLCWGDIAGEAERRGKSMPVVDSLLAATARVHHLTLVTRDTGVLSAAGVEVFDPWKKR